MPPRVQNRKEPAWSAVVLLLIFFWPVGLYLLYRKLSIPPIMVCRRDGFSAVW